MFFKEESNKEPTDELDIRIEAMKKRLEDVHKQMLYLKIKLVAKEKNIKVDKKGGALIAIHIHDKYGPRAFFKLSDEEIYSILISLAKKGDDFEVNKIETLRLK